MALPIGALALLARDGIRAHLRRLALYGAGFAWVAGPIVVRNLVLRGHLTGAVRGPSTVGLPQNVVASARVLLHQWVCGPSPKGAMPSGIVLTGLLVAAFAGWLWSRGSAREWLFERRRFLLWAWPLGYTAFIVVQRSLLHFDALGPRLLGPALVFVPLLAAVALRALLPVTMPWLAAAVTAVAVIRGGLVVDRIRAVKEAEDPRPGQDSERLHWVKKMTGPRDLLVVQRGTDIAFLLGRGSLYFTKQPEMAPVTRDDFRLLREDACPRYLRIFLVLQKYRGNEESWRAGYGPFITDLATGRIAGYSEVMEEAQFRDGAIFRLACRPQDHEVPGRR